MCQLEKYFCPYWPKNCRSYVSNDVLEITKDILINNNNNQQYFPSDYQAGLKESAVDDIDDSDDIVTDESDLNSSSLVLIIPSSSSSSQIQKSEAKHKTKVYSVASLKSPRLVLTLLRWVPDVRRRFYLLRKGRIKISQPENWLLKQFNNPTLSRGRNGSAGQPETRKTPVSVKSSESKSSTKLVRDKSNQ